MITYDTGFRIGNLFFMLIFPVVVMLLTAWWFTGRKLTLAKIALALAACLAGTIAGMGAGYLAASGLFPSQSPVFPMVLLACAYYLPFGLFGCLALVLLKAPRPKAALGGLITFAVPYAAMAVLLVFQLTHNIRLLDS